MSAISKRVFVVVLLVLAGITLLGFELAREFRGPNATGGYEIIFGVIPPDHVHDLRIKYDTHLKGNGIFLAFRTKPEHLKSVLGYEPNDAQPMYFPEDDYFQRWQHESTFRELVPEDFPDLKTLKTRSVDLRNEVRIFVFSPATGHVFCYRLVDRDLDR